MSFNIRYAIALISLCVVPLGRAHSLHSIDYPEAVHLALTHHPRLAVTHAKIESARAALIEYRGAGLPKLNLEMNADRSDNPLSVFGYKLSQGNVAFSDFGLGEYTGPASINTVPSALNTPGYYNNFNAGFKLTVPIYAGGGTIANVKSAGALLMAARQGDRVARLQLAFDILQAYEGVITANKLIQINQEAIRAAKTYLHTTKALFKQSLVIDSDVLLAETYLRSAHAELDAFELERQNHLDVFRSLIGQPESQYVPGLPVQFKKITESIDSLTKQAIHHNPQLRSMHSMIVSNRAHIDSVKALNWPQINLELRHDWNGNTIGTGLPSNSIGLGLDWSLFTSGEHSGAEDKAIAQFKEASFQYDDMASNIRLSVIQAIRAESLADIQYRTNRINSTEAEKVVKKLTQRYGQGLVPLNQLLNSQIMLNEARQKLVLSQYHKILAHGRLMMLTNESIIRTQKA